MKQQRPFVYVVDNEDPSSAAIMIPNAKVSATIAPTTAVGGDESDGRNNSNTAMVSPTIEDEAEITFVNNSTAMVSPTIEDEAERTFVMKNPRPFMIQQQSTNEIEFRPTNGVSHDDAAVVVPKYDNNHLHRLPGSTRQHQPKRHDFTAGFCYLQKREAQRNVLKAVQYDTPTTNVDAKTKADSCLSLMLLSRQLHDGNEEDVMNHVLAPRRPALSKTNGSLDIMKGYRFPTRIQGTISLEEEDDDDDDDNTVTDSGSDSNNNDEYKKLVTEFPATIKTKSLYVSRTKGASKSIVDGTNCSSTLVLTKTFEEFIIKTIERQKRRFKHGKTKQNNVLLFTCNDKIHTDYTNAILHYKEKIDMDNATILRKQEIEPQQREDDPTTNSNAATHSSSSTVMDDTVMQINLMAASYIVQQFFNIIDIVRVADKVFKRPSADAVHNVLKTPTQIIYNDMEKYLLTQLSLHVLSDLKRITPKQAATILCWYTNYIENMNAVLCCNSNCSTGQEQGKEDVAAISNDPGDTATQGASSSTPGVQPSSLWTSDIKRLLNRYLEHGVRREMKVLMERIDNYTNFVVGDATTKEQNDDEDNLRQTKDGKIVTSLPEEIMFIIDLQVQVANEYLPRGNPNNNHREEGCSTVCAVLQICIDEVSQLVCNKMIQIQSNWQHISTIRYCSIINDISRLSELLDDYCTEFYAKYGTTAADDDDNDQLNLLKVTAENTGRELVELSILATNYLCQHIIYMLEHPDAIINSIGLSTWENDASGGAVEETILTFRDYFTDIDGWLKSDYYFPKVLQKCFHLSVQTYVESFYINTMSCGIRHSRTVATNLKNDYFLFAEFFNSSFFEQHTNKAGLLSNQDINAQLLIILSMSRIIDPDVSPSDLFDDTRNVIECVTASCDDDKLGIATTAILHLAGLRDNHSKSDSIKWVRNIARAERMIEESPKKGRSKPAKKFIIELPDLRNSPYIYKVRLHQDDIQREFEGSDIQFAQAMKDLLEPGYKKQAQMYFARQKQNPAVLIGTNLINTDKIIDGYRTNRIKLTNVLFSRNANNK